MQGLDELGVGMIYYFAVPYVKRGNFGHFLIGEAEVKDVDVLLHALFVRALGDHGHAARRCSRPWPGG